MLLPLKDIIRDINDQDIEALQMITLLTTHPLWMLVKMIFYVHSYLSWKVFNKLYCLIVFHEFYVKGERRSFSKSQILYREGKTNNVLWKCYLWCLVTVSLQSSFVCVWVGLRTDGACTGHHLECVIIITVIITIIISIIKLVSVLSEPTQQPTPINLPPPSPSRESLDHMKYTHMHKCKSTFRFYKVCELL